MEEQNSNNQNKEMGEEKIIAGQLWFSVSEAAKIGGVQTKTIRRAIQSKAIRYKVIGNRYLIDFISLKNYFYQTLKLKNKFNESGIGQYVEKWKE